MEPVGAQEQQRASLGSQIHHRGGHRKKPFGAQREKLRARHGLDDVEQQLAGVDGVAFGHCERLANPIRDHRDFQHVGVHGRDGEESDEAMLDNAVIDVFANRDGIRVCAVAQVAANGGLSQDQQLGLVGQPGTGAGAATQDAQAGIPLAQDQTVLHPARLVAQQQEVSVAQPPQQRRNLLAVGRRIVAAVIAVDLGGHIAEGGDQLCCVGGYPLDVGQDFG